jgi:hypothetical protein
MLKMLKLFHETLQAISSLTIVLSLIALAIVILLYHPLIGLVLLQTDLVSTPESRIKDKSTVTEPVFNALNLNHHLIFPKRVWLLLLS